ncbi:hypothetical protein A3G67_00835 [Candidatus Roizmanbacteria bacterium RIFCSPLOWO2_12_FULL_40_12]|uniref:Uncharacterized protein n=1 Tax=Candidatus Roizmanbacteria bacterium RIFCSPLOWO2_01_FULL_40_42 TaxID=1802066 RepID=A0A1F7J6T3_9BACT|nr:MAG: hypothetical protein A2779_02360 [Candidatus Roizmanbacteria bacterium RIFCSPHIGHO2_01_FULL_40_98]OGK27194.1 MAG: hypothetical protein A3C31_02995 [Candidatus Roizmanbacteria bacterium RIFCSPHIGHO2_02_FULL_40_53]OGK30067.1 MAG: hypothetical protein A2W49_04030 [Candidatus Roizmanbacteria bacterium RIFCSPHIGHO2_12_41_18]OGK36067.1 MAG: hypothetical protein A3E69_02940 [Candidatus Roizmanbacteria bacterium RIFCSPHIGHO2_12_FULL_40_130]OGK51306.1 MAG: hypothetical protein A3B50_02575 [Candi
MKKRLDEFVVDIEFLLISVVQGVALAALAAAAAPIVANLQLEYWPYIVSALLFILIFWSQAIMHVLGFIKWPLDMIHNFLYFVASLIEVMAFSVMNKPLVWFSLFFFFVLVAGVLYYYDLLLIKACKSDFSKTSSGKALYEDLHKEQMTNMKFFVPGGLLFNAACIFLIVKHPQIFIQNHNHVFLVGIQILFGLVILLTSLKTFKKRLALIAKNK